MLSYHKKGFITFLNIQNRYHSFSSRRDKRDILYLKMASTSTIRQLRSQQQKERLHYNTISQEDINVIQVTI